MLIKRILSGVLLVPIVALFVFLHPISFLVLVCLITALLLIEFYRLAESLGAQISKPLGVVCGLLLCLSTYTHPDINTSFLFPPFSGYFVNRPKWINTEHVIYLSIFVPLIYQIIKRETNSAFLTISVFFTGIMYIGWAFGWHLILIRNMNNGWRFVFLFIAIIWCGDTGAYAMGKLFGRHKLIPAISPGKTIEGSFGGIFWGILGGVAIKYAFLSAVIPLYHVIISGLLLGIVGQIGDLGESLLKRNANAKDSGSLIPGHGGMLDRCDSMILTAPLMYYYLKYVLHMA